MKASLLPKKQAAFPGIVIHRVGPMRLDIHLSQDRTQHPYHHGQRSKGPQQTQTLLSHWRGCTLCWHPRVLTWASVACLGSYLQGEGKRSETPTTFLVVGVGQTQVSSSCPSASQEVQGPLHLSWSCPGNLQAGSCHPWDPAWALRGSSIKRILKPFNT